MTPLQLEQLISGYIDGELSPNRKREVERLLQSDPTAKRLYDEFMAIGNELRQIQRRNLPHDFQKKLFERINAETVSISGKLVEQTTSADFTLPSPVKTAQKWQRQQNQQQQSRTKKTWLSRLKRSWVLALPPAVLLVGLVVLIASNVKRGEQTAYIPENDPVSPAIVDSGDTESVEIIPPSLPGAKSIPGNELLQSLAMKDGKPILEIPCSLSAEARDNQFIPTLLADHGYSFVIRENGNKNVTVYEFELPFDQLLPFIALMYNNSDEFKSYKLPRAAIDLLHRPSEITEHSGEPSPISIVVRLNVAK